MRYFYTPFLCGAFPDPTKQKGLFILLHYITLINSSTMTQRHYYTSLFLNVSSLCPPKLSFMWKHAWLIFVSHPLAQGLHGLLNKRMNGIKRIGCVCVEKIRGKQKKEEGIRTMSNLKHLLQKKYRELTLWLISKAEEKWVTFSQETCEGLIVKEFSLGFPSTVLYEKLLNFLIK